MYEHVLYEKKGYKAYITLNKPAKLNALENKMYSDILACLKQAEFDDEVRVVIMKGAGPCFSAGFDLTAETNVTTRPFRNAAASRMRATPAVGPCGTWGSP